MLNTLIQAKPATVIKLPADGEPSSNTRESHPPVSTKRKRKQERSEDTSHSSKRQKDKGVTMGLENLQLQRPKDLSKHHRSFKDVEALTEDRGGEPSAQTASTNDKDEPPTKRQKKVSNGVHLSMSPEQTDGESDDDTEDRPIVHESISGQTLDAGTARKTAHYAPEGETPAQREERTIFIGNLPTEILTKKVRLCPPSEP
jgi:nucleolar protein 12